MSSPAGSPYELPQSLPEPVNDGAAAHLIGRRIPILSLQGRRHLVDLSEITAGRAVVFFYPRTGVPDEGSNLGYAGEAWDMIPGARGCTPQACGFRDLSQEFDELGVCVVGLSTNTPEHQREFVERNRVPFEMLSDRELRAVRRLRLPTFEFPVESGGPTTLIKRMAWYVENSVIHKVWYPVFPPDRCAATVLQWVKRRGPLKVRPFQSDDLAYRRADLIKNWGSSLIRSRGVPFQADELEGYIAEVNGRPVGQITLAYAQAASGAHECEIITLSSGDEDRGVGSTLLLHAADEAMQKRCRRLFLTTSNDNVRALAFYQRRRMRICAVYPGMIDRNRETEPTIPRLSASGVPIRDEIELEMDLDWPW